MIKKLKDILNTYTDEELEDMDFWVNSKYEVQEIIIDEYSIDIITTNMNVKVEEE